MQKINQRRKALKNKRIKQRKMSKKKRMIRRELFRMELFLDGIVIKKKNFYVRYVGETFEEGSEGSGYDCLWRKAIKGKIYRCSKIIKHLDEEDTYYVCDETGGYKIYRKAETPEGEKIYNVRNWERDNTISPLQTLPRKNYISLSKSIKMKRNYYVRYVGETFKEYCQNNPEYGIRTAAIKDKLYRCTLTYYSEEGDKYYKIKDESGGFQLYKQAKTPEDSEIQNVERIVL